MKELGIAKIIMEKRREKGVTQDELAAYIGVSKASVSKWETGQSYPDITFLPQLAAYFNISIDSLIGYEPQMTKHDIQKLYHRFATEFTQKPFMQVYEECEEVLHKYYSCFPLLLQIATLYLNHYTLIQESEQQNHILEEIVELCQRIHTESDDTFLVKDTLSIEAIALLSLKRPTKVFDLLGDSIHSMQPEAELIAQAYLMLDNRNKAIETMQVSSYQNIIFLLSSSIQLIGLYAQEPERMKGALRRTIELVDLFDIDHLHPNSAIGLYLTGAELLCNLNDTKSALHMLERFANVVCEVDLTSLHGDNYFNQIDSWLEEVTLGKTTPRSEEYIKRSILEIVADHPAFLTLKELEEYQDIVKRIKHKLGGSSYGSVN